MKVNANGQEMEVTGVYGEKYKRDGREYPALRFVFPAAVTAEDLSALLCGNLEFSGAAHEGYTTLGGVSVTVAKVTAAEEELEAAQQQLSEARRVNEILSGDESISEETARQQRAVMEIAAQSLSGAQALAVKPFYPTWEECVALGSVAYESAGYKFRYGDVLYSCVNANPTFQADWVPGVGTAALYTQIDEEHAGTADDPIPYSGNMILESGKYYSQSGVTYRCIRDSGIALYNDLADLVGNYVETV